MGSLLPFTGGKFANDNKNNKTASDNSLKILSAEVNVENNYNYYDSTTERAVHERELTDIKTNNDIRFDRLERQVDQTMYLFFLMQGQRQKNFLLVLIAIAFMVLAYLFWSYREQERIRIEIERELERQRQLDVITVAITNFGIAGITVAVLGVAIAAWCIKRIS